jgi:ABC-type lipoprotein export system ATPase subunit
VSSFKRGLRNLGRNRSRNLLLILNRRRCCGVVKNIKVKEVSKEFSFGGQIVAALREATFDLEAGNFTCIVGPSGSGKSTLVNLLGGLEGPTAGEIFVGKIPLHRFSEKELTLYRRQSVGFIFQFFHLIPNLSAQENVELPLEFNGLPKARRAERARQCLEAAELGPERFHHNPKRLSGGEQQRVAIARALATNPPLILADEPTGNLDSRTGKAIISLLARLAREEKKIVLVVTHDRDTARQADQVLSIKDGIVSRVEHTA